MRISKNESQSRFDGFFTEVTAYAKEGLEFNFTDFRKAFGVSSSLITYLKQRGLVESSGKGNYMYKRTETYTKTDLMLLRQDFSNWMREMRQGEVAIAPTEHSPLSPFKTQELLAELKRRGYVGTLTITKEIRL